jgi:chromosome segregation ATPase
MIINKNFFLELYLAPKKALVSRKVHVILLVSLLVGGLVYLRQRTVQKQSIQRKIAELKNLGADYSQVINELQAHIDSLTSRVKYLSLDNKRLSSTGERLSQQLNTKTSTIIKKLSETKALQLQLATLDQDIIRKYDNFIQQQEAFVTLKNECSKNNSKEKDKKCLGFTVIKDRQDALTLELKGLKNKREVLLSQIARFNTGL